MLNIPVIHEVTIESHPIYAKNIDWKIQTGFNFVLGANGLGKTTLLSCIHFALTENENIGKKIKKILKQKTSKENVHVKLKCSFGNIPVTIDRYFPKGPSTLRYQSENGQHQEVASSKMNAEIAKLSGLQSISELDFLLGNFLIRQEEAHTVLWSTDIQSVILKMLFNSKEYRQKYAILKKNFGKLHTDHKQKKYYVTKLNKDLEDIKKQIDAKSSELSKLDTENDSEQALTKYQELEHQSTIAI